MMLFTTLALLMLTVGARALDESCSECTGDDCKVLDTVKVTKLCAEELCVNGASVVVSDGNPCTLDDVDEEGTPVHLPVQNCCASAADCARWSPAPNCVTAECIYTEELPTHGWCHFSTVPNCCALDKDCPALPCKNATCVPTAQDTLHYSPHRKRYVELGEHQLDNIPGLCEYVDKEECCQTTRDCVNQCPPGKTGFCDKGMECQCFSTGENECTSDEGCAADVTAKRECEEGCEDESKPPCYYYECDRGWCTCVFDPDRDFDDDGVCCKNDCNDRDPEIQEQILCVVGTAEEVNADGDEFYVCGATVEPTCDSECPNGLPPVSRNDTVEINGVLVLRYNCDCCDDNPAGLDQPLTCAKDENENGNNAPPEGCDGADNDYTCEQCYEVLCVLQPESGKVPSDDTSALDELCVEAKGEGYAYYPVPAEPDDGRCDFCDSVDDSTSQTPTLMCPVEYTVNDKTWTICPQADDGQEYTPELLSSCCAYITSTSAGDPTAHPQLAKYQACCAALAEGGYSEPCGECLDALALFPGSCGRCECNNEWDAPCNAEINAGIDRIIQCVNDADGDHYFDCTDIHSGCFSSRFLQATNADEECKLLFGDSFASLATVVGETDISGGNYDDTYCDCNDALADAHQLIICGTDEDSDGFLQCTEPTCSEGGYVAQAPVCQQVCAAECTEPHVEITPQNCEQPPSDPPSRRRRSTIDIVKEVAARHGWYDAKAAAASKNQRKRQLANVPYRHDAVCEELTCNNCDCCDQSTYVHPGSNYGTATPNECGHYDMNCDCMYHSTVACPNAESDPVIEDYYVLAAALGAAPDDNDDFSVGIRNLGNLTTPKYPVAPFTATPDRLGYCGDDCDNMCMDFTTGILLESQFGGPSNRKKKRAISIELQKSCTELVEIDNTELSDNNVITLVPGKCFEFVEGCSTPCNAEGECNADCEICTKLWS